MNDAMIPGWQYTMAMRLAEKIGPKRKGELRSEYARRLYVRQLQEQRTQRVLSEAECKAIIEAYEVDHG